MHTGSPASQPHGGEQWAHDSWEVEQSLGIQPGLQNQEPHQGDQAEWVGKVQDVKETPAGFSEGRPHPHPAA